MKKPSSLDQLRAQQTKIGADRATQAAEKQLEDLKRLMVRDSRNASTPDNMPAVGQQEYTRTVVNDTLSSVMDAVNISQVLPDIELISQIVISQILSPKDMITVSLMYTAGSTKLGDLNASLVRIVKDYLEDDYKIKDRCPEIIRRALFETGSYPISVIPRTTIDQVITNAERLSRESYDRILKDNNNVKMLGILNKDRKQGWAQESSGPLVNDQSVGAPAWRISVHDNPDVFKLKSLLDKRRSDLIMEAYGQNSSPQLSVEDKGQTKDKMREKVRRASLYNSRSYTQNTVLDLTNIETKTQAADDDGSPLVIVWPSESVVTVHPPGDPTKPIGYFVACDQYGAPVRATDYQDFYHQFNRNMNQTPDQGSNILSRMGQTFQGTYTLKNEQHTIDAMLPIFSKVIENELIDRLSSGVLMGDNALSCPEEFHRLMFMRACQEMRTQLIFVPDTLMTYFAFDYNKYGIGISLLEKTKTVASFRALIGVSNILGSIKNSTNYRKLHVDLNPNDADPRKTITQVVDQFARQTQQGFPYGVINPLDLADYITRFGTQVSWSGHPRLGESNISVENIAGSMVDVNTDLEDRWFKMHCWGLGCPPELVDASTSVDYAAQVHQSSLMFVKRGILFQQTFCTQLTDHARKYCSMSGELMKKLKEEIRTQRDKLNAAGIGKSNSEEEIALHFINNLEITLPQPDFSLLQQQMDQFQAYGTAVDSTIDSLMSTDILGSDFKTQMSKLGESVDNMSKILKAYFKRKWLQDRGIMSEIFDLLHGGDDNESIKQFASLNASQTDDIRSLILEHIAANIQANKRSDALITKVDELAGGGDSSGSGGGTADFSGGSSGGSGDDNGDDGGFADFSGGGGEDKGESKEVNEAEDAFAAFDKATGGGDDKGDEDKGGGDKPADDKGGDNKDDAFAGFGE